MSENLLHKAVASNNIEVVKFLLANGVNPDEKDNDGFSPIQLAYIYNCDEIVKLLKEVTTAEGISPFEHYLIKKLKYLEEKIEQFEGRHAGVTGECKCNNNDNKPENYTASDCNSDCDSDSEYISLSEVIGDAD